jgi:hypothetical protein
MKKIILFGMICSLCFSISALGYSGGPDNFGHVWKDNTEPDGPTFNYINIKNTGTLLGNGDDSTFGAISIGFSFPFYSAAYDSFYVNTNGLITLTELNSRRQNYCPVPDSGVADFWIAPFWDDLNLRPADSAGIYYQYFDAATDYLVIQWHNFCRYSEYGDPMDMEVVLYADGVIIFQYNHINTSTRGQGQDATVGIEKNYTDGLTSLCNGVPTTDLLHSGLAIGWYPPVINHDIAVISINSPLAYVFVTGGHVPVAATLKNNGLVSENFNAYLDIKNSSDVTVFRDTVAMSLAIGATGPATFSPWVITSADNYAIIVTEGLTTDQIPDNNSLTKLFKGVNAVSLPVTQDFEGAWPPEGWTVIDRSGDSSTFTASTIRARSPVNSAQACYDAYGAPDDWLVLAPINLSSSSGARWEYYEDQSHWANNGLRHSLYASTGEFFDPLTATPLAIQTPANHTIAGFSGDPESVDLTAYAGNSHVWLAYRYEQNSGANWDSLNYVMEYWWIDDVSITNIVNADIGVYSIDSPFGGFRTNCNSPVEVTVKNYGLQAQVFAINVVISGSSHGQVYNNTVTGINLTPGATQAVSFPTMTDADSDSYTLTATVQLSGDQNPSNDMMTGNFYVSTTIEHTWDDNIAEGDLIAYPFNNGMLAVKFTPQTDNFILLGGNIFIRRYNQDQSGYAEFEWVKFCPDLGGAPDIENAYATVEHVGTYVAPTTIAINIPVVPVTGYNGDIWIVAKYADSTTYFLAIGTDSSRPKGKSFSNTAGDPPTWEGISDENLMMRVDVQYSPCSSILCCAYHPGDCNGNGTPNGIDVTYGVGYFKGGPRPPVDCGSPVGPCPQPSPFYAALDVNGNCTVNGIDITYFVGYLKGLQPALLYCPTCPPCARLQSSGNSINFNFLPFIKIKESNQQR